jgi:hypothetical protein
MDQTHSCGRTTKSCRQRVRSKYYTVLRMTHSSTKVVSMWSLIFAVVPAVNFLPLRGKYPSGFSLPVQSVQSYSAAWRQTDTTLSSPLVTICEILAIRTSFPENRSTVTMMFLSTSLRAQVGCYPHSQWKIYIYLQLPLVREAQPFISFLVIELGY